MGRYTAHLVGESNYQKAVARLRIGELVRLVQEPSNPHDPRAIFAIGDAGDTIGYIERDSWITRTLIDERGKVTARVKEIIGGGRGEMRGVVIEVLTADDAAAPYVAPARAGMSTGMKLGLAAVGLVLFVGYCSWPTRPPSGAERAEAEAAAMPVTAEDLQSAYRENVVAARQTFGDKPLMVSGTIATIGESDIEEPYLDLAEGIGAVLLLFERDAAPEIAKVKVGDPVRALCTEVIELDGDLRLDGCALAPESPAPAG